MDNLLHKLTTLCNLLSSLEKRVKTHMKYKNSLHEHTQTTYLSFFCISVCNTDNNSMSFSGSQSFTRSCEQSQLIFATSYSSWDSYSYQKACPTQSCPQLSGSTMSIFLPQSVNILIMKVFAVIYVHVFECQGQGGQIWQANSIGRHRCRSPAIWQEVWLIWHGDCHTRQEWVHDLL